MNTHNPDNLTPEQIGIADEWRLLDEDEAMAARGKPIPKTCWWDAEDQTWTDTDLWMGGPECTLRTLLSRSELRAARGLEPVSTMNSQNSAAIRNSP